MRREGEASGEEGEGDVVDDRGTEELKGKGNGRGSKGVQLATKRKGKRRGTAQLRSQL